MWTTILTGVFADFVGTPGLVQWKKLNQLYDLKRTELNALEADLQHLQTEISRIEKDPDTQKKEIRRILGYVAADELVFEFEPEQVAPPKTRQNLTVLDRFRTLWRQGS